MENGKTSSHNFQSLVIRIFTPCHPIYYTWYTYALCGGADMEYTYTCMGCIRSMENVHRVSFTIGDEKEMRRKIIRPDRKQWQDRTGKECDGKHSKEWNHTWSVSLSLNLYLSLSLYPHVEGRCKGGSWLACLIVECMKRAYVWCGMVLVTTLTMRVCSFIGMLEKTRQGGNR